MTFSVRRAGLLAAAVLVALGGWLAVASPAAAHNVLRSTSPADQSTVERVPSEVVLTFDEPALGMGTALVVTGPAGVVSIGPARLVDNTVAQSVKAGSPAGSYTVEWRVTSADGHPISGSFGFTARSAGPTALASVEPSDAVSPPASEQSGGVPGWIWVVIAAALLLSAVTSAAVVRRRGRRRS